MSSSTQDGMKRVAQLSPSSMYDIEDIDIRRTLERRRHNIFILPTCVASYNSQWDHVCYIGSAPRLAEDVAPQVPVSLPAPRAKAL
jgi:hypothetical protein